MSDLTKYETVREDWMPSVADINYRDPKLSVFKGSKAGELNDNYRHGGRCGTEENMKAYHKEYYKKYYQEHKQDYKDRYEASKL